MTIERYQLWLMIAFPVESYFLRKMNLYEKCESLLKTCRVKEKFSDHSGHNYNFLVNIQCEKLVKRNLISTTKTIAYELSHKLANDIRLGVLRF